MPHAPVEATIIFRPAGLMEGLEKLRPGGHEAVQPPLWLSTSQTGRAAIKAEADGAQARAELPHTDNSGKPRGRSASTAST